MKVNYLSNKKELKEWADTVKLRDGHRCVICGVTERINAHHILPVEIEETRLWLENGISLCPKHHKFSRNFSAHNNPFVFLYWLEIARPEQYKKIKDFVLANYLSIFNFH